MGVANGSCNLHSNRKLQLQLPFRPADGELATRSGVFRATWRFPSKLATRSGGLLYYPCKVRRKEPPHVIFLKRTPFREIFCKSTPFGEICLEYSFSSVMSFTLTFSIPMLVMNMIPIIRYL